MTDCVDKRVARYFGRLLPKVDFRLVPDHRQRRKVKWQANRLLGMVLVALLGGRRGFSAAEKLSARLSREWRTVLGVHRRVPDSTLADFLKGVSIEGLQRLLQAEAHAAWERKSLAGLAAALPIGMVSVDGKYDRAFVPVNHPANYSSELEQAKEKHPWFLADQKAKGKRLYGEVRCLSVCLVAPTGAAYLDCVPVLAATNEMGMFPEVMDRLVAQWGNRRLFELVSVDAGMTSKANATLVNDSNLGYLMAIKEGQPAILAELKRLFGDSAPDYTYRDRYRGANVLFRLWRTTEIAGWNDWSHLRQGLCIERVVLGDDGVQVKAEKRYFVTNLLPKRLTLADWALVIRTHWGVENGAHWSLDVGMQEGDLPWSQEPHAMLAVALLRRLAMTLLGLLRACYLRSCDERRPTWHQLQEDVHDILRLAKAEDLTRQRDLRANAMA